RIEPARPGLLWDLRVVVDKTGGMKCGANAVHGNKPQARQLHIERHPKSLPPRLKDNAQVDRDMRRRRLFVLEATSELNDLRVLSQPGADVAPREPLVSAHVTSRDAAASRHQRRLATRGRA